jgi:hypothetical protein
LVVARNNTPGQLASLTELGDKTLVQVARLHLQPPFHVRLSSLLVLLRL